MGERISKLGGMSLPHLQPNTTWWFSVKREEKFDGEKTILPW